MKIAQVCHRYHPYIGGVETHVKEISERLVSFGNEVEVITTDSVGSLPKNEILNGVKITRFKSYAPEEAYYFTPQIYFYLLKNRYDIVHAHNYHAFPAFFAAISNNGKFVFTPHYHRGGHTFLRNLLHKPYKIFGNFMFSRANCIICVSEYEKKLITEDFTVSNKKIKKIPNGINLQEFENIKYKPKNGVAKKLLYVGRLEKYKGVQHIIRALSELPDYVLCIIGKGPFEHDLHKLANNLGVSYKIEWFKDVSREELLKLYASADVFLMLSKHEAYGITVAEALASGTPCIVTLGSALDDFVDDIFCIGLKPPIDKMSIVREIEIFNTNKEKRKHKKNNILKDWNEIVKKIEYMYHNI